MCKIFHLDAGALELTAPACFELPGPVACSKYLARDLPTGRIGEKVDPAPPAQGSWVMVMERGKEDGVGDGAGRGGSEVGEDPIDGLLLDDEEGPTLTLGTLEGVLRRSRGPANPSIGSFVASDEAMRVFDEMSNPGGEYSIPGGAGGYSVRFSGRAEDQSLVDTLAPQANRDGAREAGLPDAPGQDLGEPLPLPTAPRLPVGADASSRAIFREGFLVFEHCPCPLFRLDDQGRIVAGNRALSDFLGAAQEELKGMELHATRLGLLHDALGDDVRACLAGRTGLQRFLSFKDASQQTVRFLLWIVPIPPSPGRPNPLAGIILPFPGE
jgi:hypothetical protein